MPTPSEELYCEIPLTQGQVALVDAADYEHISQWKWYAAWSPITCSYYAQRNAKLSEGRQRTVHMHRAILGLERGDGYHADHKDRNTLDNRRINLRKATSSQNQANSRVRAASGFKGVYWRKDLNKWNAQIGINRKLKNLGYYMTPEDAHKAYCDAAALYHGEFARTL